ncbi:MAG: YbaB/EbfC family nucleoid-associated protein [Candidatus Obscuribacterales bacterium]|nr:YbaB/EbfC family nucleoid-associated protein [Candidatus Obscuribacterales bacterium]
MQPDMNQLFQSLSKMQEKIFEIQNELQHTVIEGSSGGGSVKVTCNGAMEFKSAKISPDAIDPTDAETLEDLVVMAANDAIKKCQALAQEKMAPYIGGASGMPLPPGMGPF